MMIAFIHQRVTLGTGKGNLDHSVLGSSTTRPHASSMAASTRYVQPLAARSICGIGGGFGGHVLGHVLLTLHALLGPLPLAVIVPPTDMVLTALTCLSALAGALCVLGFAHERVRRGNVAVSLPCVPVPIT